MNVTIALSDDLVARVREIAQSQGTTLNELVRRQLELVAGRPTGEALADEMRKLWAQSLGARAASESAGPMPTIPVGPDGPRFSRHEHPRLRRRCRRRTQASEGTGARPGALANGDGVISTQVLQEYFAVATRKLSVAAEAAQKKVELLAALVAVTIDADHIIESIKLHRLYNLSFWDALIVHAARRAGCVV